MSKLPTVVVHGAALGGAALVPLPEDCNAPSLADILPYAPSIDRSELIEPLRPAERIGYPNESDTEAAREQSLKEMAELADRDWNGLLPQSSD